ncbi:MAG: LPS assembly lipoprotein LptE [Luteolibacter sp.]
MKALALLAPFFLLASCAGYQLGGIKPKPLAHVRTIAVPMFENGTLHPRAEALATSSVTNALMLDGTYKISRIDNADAVLRGKLTNISYSTLTVNRLDTLRPEELHSTVKIDWQLVDAKNPTKVLISGVSSGDSSFFVDSNLQTARNNALPDALQKAGEVLVSRLANGY